MRRLLRYRPSPAMVVALVALFVALSAGAAANLPGIGTVNSRDILNNTVRTQDIRNNNLLGRDIRNGTVRSRDVNDDSLTGPDILESSLGKVPSAANADTATLANSIADNTVRSANVVDGSLTGDDVGRNSGSTADNPASVAANQCNEELIDTNTNTDMQGDAIVVTAEDNWPDDLNFSVENADSPGFFRLNICNPTGLAIDPPEVNFHWVAFDVVD